MHQQRSRDLADAQEWRAIQNFAAECRRLWPGAKITLRPNDPNEFAQPCEYPAGVSGNTMKDKSDEQ
jgi:hypothetical protein